MRALLLLHVLLHVFVVLPCSGAVASWYGEEHRGRLMANRKPFNPDALTCASWFHPLGTRLVVARADGIPLNVVVTVTDRGPHRRFVRQGRVIDLSRAAFAQLEGLESGLIAVTVHEFPAKGTRVRHDITKKRLDAGAEVNDAARATAVRPEPVAAGHVSSLNPAIMLAPLPIPAGRNFSL